MMLSISRICSGSAIRMPQLFGLASRNVNKITPLRSYANLVGRRQQLFAHNLKAFQHGCGTISLRLASDSSQKRRKAVGYWLLTCSGMVFVAVVLGIGIYYGLLQGVYTVVEEVVKKTRGT